MWAIPEIRGDDTLKKIDILSGLKLTEPNRNIPVAFNRLTQA